ncbi:hypothetical protein [Thermoactinomyces sp. DSM 45892]|uniref:hypothetical protein n=1 Tax=Thermoactinomyces sp. DSM 45892 TaxID=1882753 RepID=UPI0008947E4C|nr:hypothetical protein [Thermoactinomyces sp. DSM 45892]SDY72618.1 hypothetical protein SAMN05444416_107185 [Thermoactinomyces sp. DSM 45892]
MKKILLSAILATSIIGASSQVLASESKASNVQQDKLVEIAQYNLKLDGSKAKIIAYAFRNGGKYLDGVLEKLSPKAGKVVRSNSDEIADFFEKADLLGEKEITSFFIKLGLPYVDALTLVKLIGQVA